MKNFFLKKYLKYILIFPVFLSSLLAYNHANSVISSTWRETLSSGPYITPGYGYDGGEFTGWIEVPETIYYLNAWSNFRDGYNYKEVRCNVGEVVTGARFYMVPDRIDDEHVDALCSAVDIDMSKISVAYWLGSDGYNASCPSGQVMVGLRMFGAPTDVDDEHVDALCAGLNLDLDLPNLSSIYTEPYNAWQKVSGYKSAECSGDNMVTGIKFMKIPNRVDDEHVGVYCSNVKDVIRKILPPIVNIKFE